MICRRGEERRGDEVVFCILGMDFEEKRRKGFSRFYLVDRDRERDSS